MNYFYNLPEHLQELIMNFKKQNEEKDERILQFQNEMALVRGEIACEKNRIRLNELIYAYRTLHAYIQLEYECEGDPKVELIDGEYGMAVQLIRGIL